VSVASVAEGRIAAAGCAARRLKAPDLEQESPEQEAAGGAARGLKAPGLEQGSREQEP
jgi:hypothetical protein